MRERKESAMQRATNQENLIMIFFGVTLILSSIYFLREKNVEDIVYFGVLMYYFIRFLVIKCKRV